MIHDKSNKSFWSNLHEAAIEVGLSVGKSYIQPTDFGIIYRRLEASHCFRRSWQRGAIGSDGR